MHIKLSTKIGHSFVSFANEAICDYMDHPPLASIEQYPYKQGEKATETLLQLMEKGNEMIDNSYYNILLPSQLIVRIAT